MLGSGASGRVTLHKEGSVSFAIKSIPHQLLEFRQMENALSTERKALTLCDACPWIVQYYVCVDGPQHVIPFFELLKNLSEAYAQRGSEANVKLHVACVAEAC